MAGRLAFVKVVALVYACVNARATWVLTLLLSVLSRCLCIALAR